MKWENDREKPEDLFQMIRIVLLFGGMGYVNVHWFVRNRNEKK